MGPMSVARNDRKVRNDERGAAAPVVRKYGSKRACWQQEISDSREADNNSSAARSAIPRSGRTSTGGSSTAACSKQYGRTLEQPRVDCLQDSKGANDRIVPLQSALVLRVGVDGGSSGVHRFRSRGDEVAHLVKQAVGGGEAGRTAAIALAKACKSSETRKAIRENDNILSDVTNALLVSLRGLDRGAGGNGGDHGGGAEKGHIRDEALVHSLVVAVFILSKDATVATRFSAAVVSALASLIEESKQNASGIPAAAATAEAGDSERTAPTASLTASVGEAASLLHGAARSQQSRGQYERQASSAFCLDNDVERSGVITSGIGASIALKETVASAIPVDALIADHGSADVLARARMLLDMSDMIPWGMANRHLVSAADLALAALLNVATRASPDASLDSGEGGGGEDSIGDELSTQESVLSKSQGSSTLAALTNEAVGDGDTEGSTKSDPGVIEMLGRLGPSGFLFSVVVDGAAVLESLSNLGLKNNSIRRGYGVGIGTDPSALRLVNQLLLGLRLLDLATLNGLSSDRTNKTTSTGTPDSPSGDAKVPHPSRDIELASTLLLIVSRCQSLVGDTDHLRSQQRDSRANKRQKVGGLCAGGARQNHSHHTETEALVGEEVTSRVHDCMLATLRVLINVTHHNAPVCAEVAARGGLDTLMLCLVVHSRRSSTAAAKANDSDVEGGHDSPISGHGRISGGFSSGDIDVVEHDLPRNTFHCAKGGMRHQDNAGRFETGKNAFDAQILALGALINCVELKESAGNCVAMACLPVHPPPSFGSRAASTFCSDTSFPSPQCFAPEFLAQFLVESTQGFAKHLEGGIRDESDEEQEPTSVADGASRDRGVRGEQATASSVESSALTNAISSTEGGGSVFSAVMGGGREEEEAEELMSAAEGAELVLGGHCALLLGLLVREDEKSRRLALPVLPDGSPTLIVRVLEAFMALQWQAGVLTEEVVLAVRELVEELEGMESLQPEEWNPFAVDDEDIAPTTTTSSTEISTAASLGGNKGRRRPGNATAMPPAKSSGMPASGQWANDLNGRTGDGGDFAMTDTDDFVRFASQDGSTASQRTPRVGESGSPYPSSAGRTQSSPTPAPRLTNSPTGSVEQTTPPTRDYAVEQEINLKQPLYRADRAPCSPNIKSSCSSNNPERTRRGGLGLGLGGSTAGTRNWLGTPRSRTYGTSWKKHSRSIGGFRSSVYGSGGLRARSGSIGLGPAGNLGKGKSSCSENSGGKGAFDFDADGSEEGATLLDPNESAVSVGVGPRNGRSFAAGVGLASSSIFELDSDESDTESPPSDKKAGGKKGGRHLQPDNQSSSKVKKTGVVRKSSASVLNNASSRVSLYSSIRGRHRDDSKIGKSNSSGSLSWLHDGSSMTTAPPTAVGNAAALASLAASRKQQLQIKSRAAEDAECRRSLSPSPKPPTSTTASSVVRSVGFGPRSGVSAGANRHAADTPVLAGKAGGGGDTFVLKGGGSGKGSGGSSRARLTSLRKRTSRSPSPSLPGEMGSHGDQQRAEATAARLLSSVPHRGVGGGLGVSSSGKQDTSERRRPSMDIFDLPEDDSD